MQSPCSPQVQEGTATRLARAKCSQCRQDKKRCEPTCRNGWEPSEDRCQRCLRLGYKCGPLQSPARKLRQKRSAIGINARNVSQLSASWTGDLKYSVRAIIVDDDTRHNPGNSCLLLNGSKTSSPVLHLIPHVQHEEDFAEYMVDELTPSMQYPKDMSFLSRHVSELASSYVHLATVVAAQQLLLRCQTDLRYLDEKVAVERRDQGQFFEVVHERLNDEFYRIVLLARIQLEALEGSIKEKEEIKLNLWLYKKRTLHYQQLITSSSCSEIRRCDASMFIPMANSTFDEHDVMLCTANVMMDRRSSVKEKKPYMSHLVGTGSLTQYRKAAERLRKLVYDLSVQPIDAAHSVQGDHCLRMLQKLRHGFPASHIAFWNYNASAAIQLWRSSQGCEEVRDVFGRTLLHIAVEAGDLDTLNHICNGPGSYNPFSNAGLDSQGRSLLSVAATLGDQEIFATCLKGQAHKHANVCGTGRELLDLAIGSCSQEIVQMLLKENMISLFPNDVLTAADKGWEHMAISFLNEVKSQGYLNGMDLVVLTDVAHQKQMRELESSVNDVLDAYNLLHEFAGSLPHPTTYFQKTISQSSSEAVDLFPVSCSSSQSIDQLPSNSNNTHYYDPARYPENMVIRYGSYGTMSDPKLLSYTSIDC